MGAGVSEHDGPQPGPQIAGRILHETVPPIVAASIDSDLVSSISGLAPSA